MDCFNTQPGSTNGEKPTWHVVETTLSSMYGILLVCIYAAFQYTELVKFPSFNHWLEINGFFIYLYVISIIYFLYLLIFVLRGTNKNGNSDGPIKVVENEESHGSITLRVGIAVFGIGTLIYFVLDFVKFLETSYLENSPCFHPAFGVNSILGALFTSLQLYIIVIFPRLNLHCHKILNRFGTKHVAATNMILWLGTVIKESVEEIVEQGKEAESAMEENTTVEEGCSTALHRLIEEFEGEEEICKHERKKFVGDAVLKILPFLFVFIIEMTLIGASVFLVMSFHIGSPHSEEVNDKSEPNRVHKPHPKRWKKKLDCSSSLFGALLGSLIFIIQVVTLCLFYGLKEEDEEERMNNEGELISMVPNTIINFIGSTACVFGTLKIQELKHKEGEEGGFDLDSTLLRFSSCFSITYAIFTIITGSLAREDSLGHLHIANGTLEIIQIVLQLIFLFNLKEKVLRPSQHTEKPGRQYTIFFFLFNLSQWLVGTFEIQKLRASLIESTFYGIMPWIIIQRVTLPIAIFFRFHSAVINIELWKNIYCSGEPTDTKEEHDLSYVGNGDKGR